MCLFLSYAQDLTPTVADSFWYIKGDTSANHRATAGVTREAVFVKGLRGERAAAINKDRVKLAEIAREKNDAVSWQQFRNVTRARL